ncbi:unnamed protein product [Notodromas monacha]|uniref:ABC transporter domain-containing protein n=1 Tax=Notodromas monacha TaxID=399045 RepID=A0A7R9C2G5_9CRUS|nr:unnamed protein product [Notodromas monacha]CAG0926121.1 unnamed protein product [Notodromas monacha]
MRIHGIGDDQADRMNRAQKLLENVGLDATALNRYPKDFSGGQRQRIGIAKAIAIGPELIICDESVSALDVSVQAQVLNLLNELKQNHGFGFLFISHDLSVVYHMSDRLMVLEHGHLLELDNADIVYETPKSAYTQRLIQAIPTMD